MLSLLILHNNLHFKREANIYKFKSVSEIRATAFLIMTQFEKINDIHLF